MAASTTPVAQVGSASPAPSVADMQYPVYSWSGTHIVTEDGMEQVRETQSQFGEFAQPGSATERQIVPRPDSLYGNAHGASMTLPVGPTVLPNLPPEQEIYEAPVFVPGKGWVHS